jgi:hypothetical protein
MGLGNPPCGGIGDTDVEHFALAYQIIEGSHNLFDWSVGAKSSDPQKQSSSRVEERGPALSEMRDGELNSPLQWIRLGADFIVGVV